MKPERDVSAEPPEMLYVRVWPVSRSDPESEAEVAVNVSSALVSVTVIPLMLARVGVSFAPVIVATKSDVLAAVPSLADTVKVSVTVLAAPSIAASSIT